MFHGTAEQRRTGGSNRDGIVDAPPDHARRRQAGRFMINLTLLIFLFLTNVSFAEHYFLLNIDINIDANQEYVDLPVISKQSEKTENHIGYGIHLDEWTVTNYIARIHLKKKLKKDLVIKKNTIIVLSGKYEVEKTIHGTFAHKFFVKEPKEIEYIACGVYIDYYRDLLGEKVKLVGRSFPENYR